MPYKDFNERRTAINKEEARVSGGLTTSIANAYKKKNTANEMDDVAYNPGGVSLSGFTPAPAIEQVELETGLDFQLQDSNFELMATLRAHGCYWKNPDTALFIMTHLLEGDSPQ